MKKTTTLRMLCVVIYFTFFFSKIHAQYCTPSFNNPSQLYINRVQLNTLDHSQTYVSATNSYSDLTALTPTDLTMGQSYTLTIHATKANSGHRPGFGIWIDFNDDNDFDDANEQVALLSDNVSSPRTVTITIPSNVTTGNKRMRINMVNYYVPTVCKIDATNYGETEDYTINVVNSPTPIVNNDDLNVVKNSGSGFNNQINVSLNDNIGTSFGSDGDDYSITSSTLITANGGSVIEMSDGIFQYVPATDFIGTDSFNYTLCDAGANCLTGTVSINVTLGACIPSSNSANSRFITNVSLTGQTTSINNASGNEGGYANFTNLPAADLYLSGNYPLSITIGSNTTTLTSANHRSGWAAFIDFNQDGIFDTDTEKVYETNGTGGEEATFPFPIRNITIPANALSGNTIMRVGSRLYFSSGNPCGNTGNQPEEFEDYKVSIAIDPSSNQDIKILGNNISLVNNGTVTSLLNNTNFSLADVSSGSISKQFQIRNNGGQDLQLGSLPISLVPGSSSSFSILSQPAANTIIPSGGSFTFVIGFDPAAIGNYSASVVINSNDPDEPTFTFDITGEGVSFYPDTDGDGITNNIDIDDDNDGIRDSIEQLSCLENSLSNTVDVVFLNENFGSGTERTRINGVNFGVTTTYCYEDGTTARALDECNNIVDLDDGKYTVHYSVSNRDGVTDISTTGPDLANWAEAAWYNGEDHTPGDANGRMAIFNASYTPGIFYEYEVRGIVANAPIESSFAVINLDRASGRILPELTVQFLSLDRQTILYSYDTGVITRCDSTDPLDNCTESVWRVITQSITFPETDFVIQLINKATGGLGNDLAIDDIKITQKLCDRDGDGVADLFDLDNDNDGILNIREVTLLNYDTDYDGTTFGTGWVDANGNGMHDALENSVPLDSDEDGVYDFLDLDSDNDGVFDVLENDGYGDLDVNGDGLGDGSDANIEGILNDGLDNDGILNLIDTNDDDENENDFGTNSYADPIDSDNDGIPDYLDAYNDVTGQYDITTTIFTDLDTNNDGIIDGSTDNDFDGLLFDFDTNDAQFGSPRDLSDKYDLYFDGRNDYVEEDADIILGLQQATLMSWIKIDDTMVGNGVVVGQENFYLQITATKQFGVVLNGSNISLTGGSNILSTNKWVHIAAVFDGLNSEVKLYVNGELKNTVAAPGVINNNSNTIFRIGSLPTVTNGNYFKGQLDEVRVFNVALTENQLQKMVYQELDNSNFSRGAVIPIDISGLSSSSLLRYYRMDSYKDDILDNLVTPEIDEVSGAKIYNVKHIFQQTAPLPYETSADGNWSNENIWKYSEVWNTDLSNSSCAIVHIKNNVLINSNIKGLGLIVDNGTTLKTLSDIEVNNSWYLKLDGKLDLQNESQLVQTSESILDVTSEGSLERDQQGTADNFTYNYFSSPVMPVNTSINNGTYTIQEVLRDGTNPNEPTTITFQPLYTAADGVPTSPITLSTYWMWKFTNLPGLYANWIHVRHNGNLNSGEGFTMKGPNTGDILDEQNYVFEGKPNNGDIDLPITANNIYLVGNPYPSALSAKQFILDNPDITGTLKFWEHWGGGSHILEEYQGGYALFNLSGAVVNASYGVNDPLVGTGGTPTKLPRLCIPVAQGFFVEAINDGMVHFNNGQREFVTEASGNSIFVRNGSNTIVANQSSSDERMKIRLGYNSSGGIHRQLLVTVDENTTFDYDNRYDGKNIDTLFDDLNWRIDQENYIIQGVPSIDPSVVLPLEVKTRDTGIATFSIEDLENIPNDKEIYLKDNLLGIIHDIKASNYTTTVNTGIDDNRFELVFQNTSLSNDSFLIEGISLFFNIESQLLQINNSDNKLLEKIKLFNVIGQEVFQKELNSNENSIKIPIHVAKGVYIINLKAKERTIIKKIIIQ
ncbi:T9SS type A sorting domain-containing protein [Flavobacterium jejuense]|uniref:T9SS type A sorting domain-containing protein n=1 Tax=Flavobacterium jejuense TaxID=1544455 RepID=A0ABX0IPC7_9FLAO|nr:GEVED domain-containing protein [Flavobacterium jejuense]NHN25413.1 T9SS type A sorting domain-containing protein [Flavobacterium jejuense]